MTSARAATNDHWEVLPSGPGPTGQANRVFLAYTLDPGQVVHDAVQVRNLTAQPIALDLYPADAANAPSSGAFGLLGPNAPRTGASAWVRLATSHVLVAARDKTVVPFEVDVPPNASPGDHAAGIVAAETAPAASIASGAARIAVVQAVGVRVYTRVSGPVHPRLTLDSLRVNRRASWAPPFTGAGHAAISFIVSNNGNIRQAPTARVTVVDELGRTVATLPQQQLPDLLPGGQISVSQVWRGLPLAGSFSVRVQLHTPELTVSTSVKTWNVAWGDLGIGLMLVALVGSVGVRRWRRPIGAHSPRAGEVRDPARV